MDLLCLPNELLQLIGTFIELECDLASLVAVNRRLHGLFLLPLYTLGNNAYELDTAETWAISNGRLDVLERIYSLEVQSDSRESVLDAARAGYLVILKFLLERYPNDDKPGFDELLRLAVGSESCELVTFLLDNGADPNHRDKAGQTPIFSAAKGLDTSVAGLLVQRGAEMNITDIGGWSPLGLSAMRPKEKMMRFLIENGADIDALGYHGTEAVLHKVTRHGDIKRVRFLLRMGADPLVKCSNGSTALDYAVNLNYPAIVEKLLEHDCWDKIDVRSPPFGRTPLHNAVTKRNPTTVTVLLESAKSWINQQDLWGRTPASYAAKFGTIQILIQLISYGADLSIPDRFGATPLMVAVRNEQVNLVETLLRMRGEADCLGEKDSFGRTIFWWAKASGDAQLLDMLTCHAEEVGFEVDPSDLEAEKSTIKYNRTSCWCDICTRAVGGIRNGHRCQDCGDGWFLVCNDCFTDGRLACSSEHGRDTWIPYTECTCPIYSER